MKFDEKLPIYLQIVDRIKIKIASGKLKSKDKLPSVREMSRKLKVNPNTVQRGYQELEREDLIFTQRGMSTFITEDKQAIDGLKKDMANKLMKEFVEDMKSLGYTNKEIIELIKERLREGR